jgi:hypothetical protein
MNAFDRNIDGPAVVHYGDGEFVVMRPGRYVVCAVSGKRIPMEALRYWSPELQEPYAGPQEALKRWRETQKST